MPWSSDVPARYLPRTWPGSQRRRPAPQRSDVGTLACPRYTPGTPAISRRAETSAGELEPGHQATAAPPSPAPPRREARDELKPATAFRVAARRTQLRRPRPGSVGDLDPDGTVSGDDRDRDRLPGSTRAAMTDRITEDLADQQDRHIPARVSRTENLTHEPASSPRPLCPPGKRHALPDRQPSHHRTCPSPAAPPRETSRAAGGRRDMHAQLRRERQAGATGSARTSSVARPWSRPPSVAVRGTADGMHRPSWRHPRPSAMRPWTAQYDGLQRYKVTHDGTETKRPASTRYRS